MKNLKKLLSFIVVLTIIGMLFSCSKDSGVKNMVPKTASMVLLVDGKTLSEKSGIDNITETKTFQKVLHSLTGKELASFQKFESFFKDSEKSGLNLKSEMVMFMNASKENEKQAVFLMNISDVTKFETFIQTIMKESGDNSKIKEGEGLKYLLIEEEGSDLPMLVWDKKVAMFFTCDKRESLTIKNAATFYNLKKENTIGSVDAFDSFYKNKKDISLYIEYGSLMKLINPMYSTIMQTQMNMNMDGTTAELHLNFEKGKVIADIYQHQGKEMEKTVKNYKIMLDKFDTELLKVLPKKSYANISFAFNFNEYYKLMKGIYAANPMISIDQIEQSAKATLGMSIEEALNTIHGEMIFNIHDFAVKDIKNPVLEWDNTAVPTIKSVVPMFSALIKMNDSKAYDKLMALYGGMLTKKGNYYVINDVISESMYLGLANNILVLTNDESILKNIESGNVSGGSLFDTEIASNLKKFPTYGFMQFDMNEYPAGVISFLEESTGDDFPFYKNLLNSYKSVEFRPENSTHSIIELTLKDNSQNSLNVILKSFDDNVDLISEK